MFWISNSITLLILEDKMKKRILLLEDDVALATLLKIRLEIKGFEVKTTPFGSEAIEFIENNADWLLLADYHLVDMTCDELVHKLNSKGIQPSFIVMTGISDQQLIVDMMKMGAIDYIIKNIGFIETVPTIIDRAFEIILMRKALEQSIENIKESELKFRNFFEKIQDIFFVIDMKGVILEISPSIKNILGFEPYDVIGKSIGGYFYNYSEYRNIRLNLKKFKLSESSSVMLKHIDGSQKYLSIVCNVVDQGERGIITIGVARDISEKKQMDALVVIKVMEAEESERKKIAEAIHDDVGPIMSVLKMYFELISNSGEDIIKRKKLLSKVQEIMDSSIQKIRAISNSLMPNVLEMYGLKKAINSFIEKITFASKINFIIDVYDIDLSKTMNIFLYRASVELINNSIKHSGASQISLSISREKNELLLTYSDNGRGFDFDEKFGNEKLSGHGLLSIIHRTSMMSGKYSIKSKPDEGFFIKIVFDNKLI